MLARVIRRSIIASIIACFARSLYLSEGLKPEIVIVIVIAVVIVVTTVVAFVAVFNDDAGWARFFGQLGKN